MAETNGQPGQIHALMAAVMRDVGAIGKDRANASQGYNFRGIDDVYNSLHAVLGKHGVYFLPEVLEHSERECEVGKFKAIWISRTARVRFTFYAPDGSSVQATTLGEGMDNGDKAANKLQSAAAKYALLQAFCIPTREMIDSETESPERGSRERDVSPPKKPAPAKPDDGPMPDAEKFIATLRDAFEVCDFQPDEFSAAVADTCKRFKIRTLDRLPVEKRDAMLAAVADGKFDKFKKAVTA